MKRCSKCGNEYPTTIEFFAKDKYHCDGFRCWCKKCQKEHRQKPEVKLYQTNYRKRPKSRLRKAELRRKYRRNVLKGEYDQILVMQHNCCAICGRHQSELKQSLCIDHDHKTGKNRGLLCHRCNLGIGFFGDNPSILQNVIVYLDRYKCLPLAS